MEFCPLCYKESLPTEVEGPMGRLFHLCENCKLVFESKSNRPDWNEEKDRYLEHNNSIHQEGYVNHLNQAIKPVLKYLIFPLIGQRYQRKHYRNFNQHTNYGYQGSRGI
jgi:hypothetical protein